MPERMPRVPDPQRPSLEELARAARWMREEMRKRDRSYLLSPLGEEVAAYLRQKRKRLTNASFRSYSDALGDFTVHHLDLRLEDFEPPVGTERVEEYLDARFGHLSPRSYNKNLSVLADFFKWAILRERLRGDPTLAVERARKRAVHRETFNADQVRAIVAGQGDARDRLAVRLLLDFGLRRESLRTLQFKSFDHLQRRVTFRAKGGKVQTLPLPSRPFWNDLERLIVESGAEPHHYLMARHQRVPCGPYKRGEGRATRTIWFPEKPVSPHGMHRWWYGCLARAGVVPEGTSSGERMHKARHTAGQRLLDATGNVKAVQRLLGHESIQTTADTYLDWDLDALARSLADALGEDE